MAFALTAVAPATIFENGGYLFQVQGTTFDVSHRFNVHVGPFGNASDPTCYSGVPEQGDVIYPWTTTKLRVYSPLLDLAGSPHKVYVIDLDTTEDHALGGVMAVAHRDFKSSVFALRKALPISWRTGPRDIDLVPPT